MEILKNVNDVPTIIAHFLMFYAVFQPILSYIFSKLKYYIKQSCNNYIKQIGTYIIVIQNLPICIKKIAL